ncbi:glycosyltransferase family 4 protein [Rhodoferax sp. 4810]|uniref:Glycosyltransferase family 4 protein n=2 Tax=Thiospirillum jenense TaxID=1653858 RepID=A0A839HFB7_9GAMM|nr:glycosyltransferase family 4 protein [Rhodoferax jenense]MBB1125857.1 glycosyltransferase family 4 protein [Thiospirillum jenense]
MYSTECQSQIRLGRILCVTSNLPRWTGDNTTPFVLHLAQDLQMLGWDITVIAPHAPAAADFELLDGVAVTRFHYAWPDTWQQLCYQGGALINLRQQPLNWLALPTFIATEWWAVLRQLLMYRYDILHSHWILPQGFIGMLAHYATLHSIPHIITAHGGDVFGLRSGLFTATKRIALHSANAVTVNSSITERAVRQLAPRQQSILRIPMGVNITPFTAAMNQHAAELRNQHRIGRGPLIVFAGRLITEKGVGDLLHALAEVRRELPDIRALILGTGQEQAFFIHLAEQLQLNNCVTFSGWIDHDQLPAYFRAADIVTAPSRTAANGWMEAQGLSVLEAMAVGTPVIATAHGGLIDSVIDGQTGLLIPESDPTALAAAIVQLHANPDLAARFSLAGCARVTARYSRSASAAQFSQLFTQLMQRYSR